MSALTNRPQRVVIVGGGIHGASIAYHLSLGAAPPDITIVERSQGSSASYKSGGFLAREWGSGPTVQLHQKSFDLHEKLAKELSLTSFRRIPVVSVSQRKGGKAAASWLDGHASTTELEGAAAQVTPSELTHRLIEEAIKNGANMVHATAVGCEHNEQGKVEGVVLSTGETLKADKMVVALGPWSGVVCEDWFDAPIPMQGIKSTSMLYTGIPEIEAEPFACFCEEDRFNCHLELYPRPDGSLYVCGCGGSDYVSGDRLREGGDCFDPASVEENAMRVEAATSALGYMSETFKTKYKPTSSQACMRPCTSDGLPTMSEIPGFEGAYVSAGHNCWGILWAPICGKAMAALMTSHDSTQSVVDLSAFHIERFLDVSKRQQKQKQKQKRGKAVGETPIGEQW